MGNWIGGTAPYFIAKEGGAYDEHRVLISVMEDSVVGTKSCRYDIGSLDFILSEAPSNGFTVVLVPAFSAVHSEFGQRALTFDAASVKPLAGWVAGCALEDVGKVTPPTQVYLGSELEKLENWAVAMHVSLSPEVVAQVRTLNLFNAVDGPPIRFAETEFSATDCYVSGKAARLIDYLGDAKIDLRSPLVSDAYG